jgi:hypothetical protein
VLPAASRPPLGHFPASCPSRAGGSFTRWPRSKADRSPPSGAKKKNEWSCVCVCTFPQVLTACCSLTRAESFLLCLNCSPTTVKVPDVEFSFNLCFTCCMIPYVGDWPTASSIFPGISDRECFRLISVCF